MHIQWNDLDKQETSNRVNNKPLNVSGYNERSEETNNKSVNSDLYQAVFPIYHVSKLCGVFPVRFIGQTSGRYQGRLSVIDSIYSVCLLMCLIGAEIWGFWRDLKDGWKNSTRLKSQNAVIVTSSDVLGVMGLTAVSIIGSIPRWKYLQIIVDKLVDCDEKLGIVTPKKIRKYTVLLTLSSLTYSIIISALDIYMWGQMTMDKMNDKGPINYVPLYFMYIVIMMMEIQYAIVTYNVGQRFQRLNRSLENILKSSKITNQFRKDLGLAGDFRDQRQLAACPWQNQGNIRMFRKTNIVEPTVANDGKNFADNASQLMMVHAVLCDSVTLINTAYGVVILVVTTTCLIHLVITPYFLIMEVDGKREPLFLLVQTMWCIFHIWRLLIFIQPTYATTTEGKRTAVLVSQLLSANHNKKDINQLEIFSLQILHRPLEFSACGLFTLDRSLLTSIAGAVTTYLVILIQFQKDDDKKGNFDNMLKNATQMLKNASILQNITVGKISLN